MVHNLEYHFRIARSTNSAKKRQEFLKLFFQEYPSKYVSGLFYKFRREGRPNQKIKYDGSMPFRIQEDNSPLACCCFNRTFAQKNKSAINIYPVIFSNNFNSYLSFWNTIVNHEYVHAQDHYEGIKLSEEIYIDNTNITNFDIIIFDCIHSKKNLKDYLFQSRAYLNEIKEIRKLPRYIQKKFKEELKYVKKKTRSYQIIFDNFLERFSNQDDPRIIWLVKVAQIMSNNISKELNLL